MVYFIQAQSGGPIKIGYTKSAESVPRRLKQLQTGVHEPLIVLATTALHTEEDLHQRFADLRLHGEWFKLHPRLVGWILGHAMTTPEGRKALYRSGFVAEAT